MTGHRLEVADVFHAHQNQFLQRWGHVVSDQQRKALRDIGRCRTAALGTHLERCDRCNYETVAYDSCPNRHCPKCQSSAGDRWLMKQASSLLPVPYAHVVFTVLQQLAPLALRNQRLFYNLLFRAASETLLEIAADPRHLGARVGVLAVLHTWSQNLGHHPHLHCLVPAGGLALDNSCWVATRRRNFFLPVRVLSRMFRGKLLAFLKQSYRRNELCFAGRLSELAQPQAFYSMLHTLRRRDWVVYSKPPFGGPELVLKYLARYTHRVAISNGRLLSLDNGQVRFRWRDSRHNNRSSVMTLDAVEFIRRFLLHVLPSGLRQDPPLRSTRQPQPPSGPSPVQEPSPRHRPGQQRTADRTAEVRTQPILSSVQTRHPARDRSPTVGQASRLPRTRRLRALRLILRKTMSTRRPTRFLPSTGSHPANATPWLESASHDLHAGRSLPMLTAGTPLNGPAQVTVIPFRAQSAASTHRKQLSIPILLPR
jgi:hypothetical protein